MLILKVDPKKPEAATLKKAVTILRSGGLVVYPTETAYALGCDPKNSKAVKRLFSVKKRDASKPLPLIAASKSQALKNVRSDVFERSLAEVFWPGPLTIVAAPAVRFAMGVASKRGEVALRVSPHPVAAALAARLGRPVISTSANRSGTSTAYDIVSVLKDLGTSPDLVLDAGRLAKTPTSTIVRVKGGAVEILRAGPMTEEDLRRALMRMV